ncbi:glycoside hydrolase family 26 protein [Chitinophaga sancti]|uniref:Mannan endo-1,4-beta-mannosidase n=1 Tax=Chitinophaga sancti TaxID=1004 RepID=A0A1K1NA76_9BACT|nr:glycosyl hydrolase [Chitinophaga sancti]WQD63425.1 glycosyl hydrolase [Chitinophaga sancti]WQG90949.1 glycosyl hydrolase [Chitinophaga sancti]SFW32212.1 mannan endo-1,4-beta-mannosidase [Chitinophaga sancti]
MKLYCVILLFLSTPVFAQADQQANTATKNLYKNLQALPGKGFLVGHQDDLAYGVNWKYKEGNSDVKAVCGDYPGLYGWDLGGIELSGGANNLDGVPFRKMRQYIKEGFQRGGVITISWHARSPLGAEKGAWDTTHGTVTSILPGGVNHALYKAWLDKVAGFLQSLDGIPVLFRPFHELTGNWFWWGRSACTPAEFITLWRFTVYYLKAEKHLHNLLYVYNTGGETKREIFLERYPGDDMVDVISFDSYQYDDGYVKNVQQQLALLDSIATEKGKIPAFGETGYEAIPDARWWTQSLLNAIGSHKIAWVLLWRNHGYNESMKKMHYYMPYPGQGSADDFRTFYNNDKTLFERDAAAIGLYK